MMEAADPGPLPVKKKRGGKIEGAGRKPIKIDWRQVEELCKILCTWQEIAAVMHCSKETLASRCKKDQRMSLQEYYDMHSAHGKIALRRQQFRSALGVEGQYDEDGNVLQKPQKPSELMMKHLGTNWLGQSDGRTAARDRDAERVPTKIILEYAPPRQLEPKKAQEVVPAKYEIVSEEVSLTKKEAEKVIAEDEEDS